MLNAPLVRVYLEPEDKIEHAASTYAGFHALEAIGELKFDLIKRPEALYCLREDDGLVICGVFKAASGEPEVRFSIDLRDRSDLINYACLDWCQIYFKRSLAEDVLSVSAAKIAQDKIVPMGVNFAARSKMITRGAADVLKGIISMNPLASIDRIRRYVSLPPLDSFEQTPNADLAPFVLFQTRLWTENELELTNSRGLNQRRIDLVVALKNHFGPQFKGGLVGNPLALAKYPELISNLPSGRRAYAMAAKQQLIGVYSEGLSGSTAFKFLEYLAASQCIVAEKFSNRLPANCQEGKNYLSFTTPSECIVHCERLLTNSEEARMMRYNNVQLYEDAASPIARARHLIEKLQVLKLSPN
jgi:hypothetical protein